MVHVEGAAAIGLLPQRVVRGADQSREGTPERRDEERGPKPRQVRHRHHASDEGSNEPPVLNDAKRGAGLDEATKARRGARHTERAPTSLCWATNANGTTWPCRTSPAANAKATKFRAESRRPNATKELADWAVLPARAKPKRAGMAAVTAGKFCTT